VVGCDVCQEGPTRPEKKIRNLTILTTPSNRCLQKIEILSTTQNLGKKENNHTIQIEHCDKYSVSYKNFQSLPDHNYFAFHSFTRNKSVVTGSEV
jgi:hypothetical protein